MVVVNDHEHSLSVSYSTRIEQNFVRAFVR